MITVLNHKTDSNHLKSVDQNNLARWHCIFEFYAPIMYGSILRLISSKAHAQNILLEAFLMLKENKLYSKFKKPLCIGLLIHTHKVALKYLRNRKLKINSEIGFYWQNPLLGQTNSIIKSLRLANQIASIKEIKIPEKLRVQITGLNAKPPEQLLMPKSSLSSFYLYTKSTCK